SISAASSAVSIRSASCWVVLAAWISSLTSSRSCPTVMVTSMVESGAFGVGVGWSMVVNYRKRRRESRSRRYNPHGGGSSWAQAKVRQQSVPVPNRLALSWPPPGAHVGCSGYRGREVLATGGLEGSLDSPRVDLRRSPSHFALRFGTTSPYAP